MTLASALWTFEKKIFQRGDLHVLLAQQSDKDLGTNWSYWGACRGSGALNTLACVAGIWKGRETFKCLPRFYFFALLFTSHRSPLSERLEQAKHWGAFHRKFGKSGKWYGKSRKSVQKFRKLLNFRNFELNHSTENSRNSGSKVGWKENFREKIFRTFGYTSRGCPLFWKFWKKLFHSLLKVAENSNRTCWLNGKRL